MQQLILSASVLISQCCMVIEYKFNSTFRLGKPKPASECVRSHSDFD
jgi:hypothetical protein